MEEMALSFANGKNSCKKNPKKARKWLLAAAKVKHAQSLYHLAECYYLARGMEQPPYGDFGQSYEEAFNLYSASADIGFAASYLRLAEMYRGGHYVEADPQKALELASLAAYQQTELLQGRDCEFLYLHYANHWADAKSGSRAHESRDFDLSVYWVGRAMQFECMKEKLGEGLSQQIAMYSAKQYWFKHTSGIVYPGYSTLPLAKQLETKYNIRESDSSIFIQHWKDRCALATCKKKNEGTMKVCTGCRVFYFCDKDCQRKHWKAGHKRECKGNHWIKEFLPDL